MATIGETVSGGTAGSVLFVGAGPVLAQDNANLFWDNSGKKLGIGTTSPSNGLTVQKSSTGTVGIDVINTNTTSGAANAQVFVQVAGPNGGDAVTVYEVFNTASWIVGIDNSESDKFKFVAVTTGPQLSMAMTTDGKVGVNVNDPTARLHLSAGTASLAPLKLTAGTLLSAPEVGAVEFDGTDLFITLSDETRRILTSHVVNVRDFGAKGDGTTDDAAAFQAAVNSLVNDGGVVWVPPEGVYKISSSIEIRSFFPIWIISDMGHGPVMDDEGDPGPGIGKGYIKVGGPITGGIFVWGIPATGATYLEEAGGGGIRHVHIVDEPLNLPNHLGRNHAIDAAVYVEGCTYFMVDDCWFSFLKGTAIKVGRVTVCRVNYGRISRCGNTDHPAVHVFGDGLGGWGAMHMFGHVLEGTHLAPSVKIEPATGAIIQRTHFEANVGEAELQQTFVHCSSGCTLIDNGFGALGTGITQVLYDGTGDQSFNRITGNVFGGNGTALSMTSAYQFANIAGNFFDASGSANNTDSITIASSHSRVLNNKFYAAGRANVTGQSCLFANNYVFAPTASATQGAIEVTSYSQVVGNHIDGDREQTGIPKSVCMGIRASGGWSHIIHSNMVRSLNNATGIEATAGSSSSIQGNYITELNGGTAIVPGAASLLRDNFGHPDELVNSNTIASSAISNTVVETAFDQFYTIPANRLRAGDVIRVRAQGIATSTNATDTLDIHLQIAGQQVMATGPIDVANNDIFVIDAEVIIRSTGSPGTMVAAGWTAVGANGAVTAKAASLVSGNINTTLARDVVISATWSVASPANSVRLDLLTVEILSK